MLLSVININMLCRQHRYPWPSLATPSYRSSLLAGPQGSIPYPLWRYGMQPSQIYLWVINYSLLFKKKKKKKKPIGPCQTWRCSSGQSCDKKLTPPFFLSLWKDTADHCCRHFLDTIETNNTLHPTIGSSHSYSPHMPSTLNK